MSEADQLIAAVRAVQERLVTAASDAHALDSDYVYGYMRGLKKAVEELELVLNEFGS